MKVTSTRVCRRLIYEKEKNQNHPVLGVPKVLRERVKLNFGFFHRASLQQKVRQSQEVLAIKYVLRNKQKPCGGCWIPLIHFPGPYRVNQINPFELLLY